MGASKISMDVAEPLPRVYLDMFQKMVSPIHHFTPCCTLVAPRLGWDPHPLCTVGLLPLHKPMRCAAFPIRARCGLWPSVHPSTRAPAIHFVAPGVTQRLNSGIPGLIQKALLHSSELLVHSQMLTVALLAMFTGVANPEILRMVTDGQYRELWSTSWTPPRHVCRGTNDIGPLPRFRQDRALAR